jgi:DNA polymerase III subunit chi
MRVELSGAESGRDDDPFDLIVLLFDGRDEVALAHARGEWRRLKDLDRMISYWRESDEGGWERAR